MITSPAGRTHLDIDRKAFESGSHGEELLPCGPPKSEHELADLAIACLCKSTQNASGKNESGSHQRYRVSLEPGLVTLQQVSADSREGFPCHSTGLRITPPLFPFRQGTAKEIFFLASIDDNF